MLVALVSAGCSQGAPSGFEPEAVDLAMVPRDAADGGRTREPPRVSAVRLTQAHRYVPGKMFGGWGPHLGHLVRRPASSALYWVDDACAQAPAASDECDVLHNRRLDYVRLDAQSAALLGSQPLPQGVQQNTGSVQVGNTIYSYGIDVVKGRIVECKYVFDLGPAGCTDLALDIGTQANYVGAAVSPSGARVVWLTNVRDGGGGEFRYYVDYGGGWNGPRLGNAGGYNDASYINIAFFQGKMLGRFTMHVQFVSGLAPNWTFVGGAGDGDLRNADPVAWQLISAPMADPVVSTNDIYIDPTTGDSHLLSRTMNGSIAYLFRPSGGSFSSVLWAWPSSYRARFITFGSRLFLVYGEANRGLFFREVPRGPAGQPADLAAALPVALPLPAGYETIYAIYPESSVYQSEPVGGLNLVVVSAGRENEAIAVHVELAQ